MDAPLQPQISFRIDKEVVGECRACYEQNGQRYSALQILEVEQTEYSIGDNPIPESISGHFMFALVRTASAQRQCPYEIKVNTNLVRNEATSGVYKQVDELLDLLHAALAEARPGRIEIPDHFEALGWRMSCSGLDIV